MTHPNSAHWSGLKEAVDACSLSGARAQIDGWDEDLRASALTDPDALGLLLEHAHQLMTPSRMRALSWRLRRVAPPELAPQCARHEIRHLLARGKMWHALQRLDAMPEMVDEQPELGALHFAVLGNLKRLGSAARRLEALDGRLDPGRWRVLEARYHWMDDQRERARESLVALEPEMGARWAPYWRHRTYIELELGLTDEAARTARKGLEHYPEFLPLRFALARVLEVADEAQEAADVWQSINTLSPGNFYEQIIQLYIERLVGMDKPSLKLPIGTLGHRRHGSGANTLSLIAGFWGRDVSQESIAADCTRDDDARHPNHLSRHQLWRWARDNGFDARPFRGDARLVRTLLRRGWPVVTERSWARGSNLYIFVGYSADELILRDPDDPAELRVRDEDFDEAFAFHDGWCLLILPPDQAAVLESAPFTLPDVAAHERSDELADGLQRIAPDQHIAAIDAAELGEVPNKRDLLTITLASQLGDVERVWELGQQLVDRNAEHGALLARIVRIWTHHLPPQPCLELCQAALQTDGHPATLELLVEVLVELREVPTARDWARRTLVHYPAESSAYVAMALVLTRLESPEQALELLRIAKEIEHHDPQAMTRVAFSLTTLGRLEEAVEVIDRALALDDRMPLARHCRARALERLGAHSEAISAYEQNIERAPWYPQSYSQLFSLLADRGDHAGARAVLERGCADARPWQSCRLDLAYFDLAQGEVDAARSGFEALLERQPGYAPATVGLARIHLAADQPGLAIPLLEKTLEDYPDHGPAQGLLLDALERQGDLDEQVTALLRWLEHNPGDSSFDRQLAAKLHLAGRLDEFVERLQQLADDQELDARATMLCRLANVLITHDRLDDARVVLDRLDADHADEAWGQGIRGDWHWQRQEFDEAVARYQRALGLWPGYQWAMRRIAMYHMRRFEPEAIEWAHKLIELDTGHLPLLIEVYQSLGRDEEVYDFLVQHSDRFRELDDLAVHCGILQERMGNLDAAATHFEEALRLDPANSWAMGRLAAVELRRHDEARALELYDAALRINPDYSWLRDQYCQLLVSRGRVDDALALAREGLERAPGADDVQTNLRDLYARLGRHVQGAGILERYVERVDDPASLLSHAAVLRHQGGDTDVALILVDRAAGLAPHKGWPHRLAGLFHYDSRRYDDAETSFRACLERERDDLVSWKRLVDLNADRGRYEVALECIDGWAAVEPDDLELLRATFDVCRAGGLWEEGERRFTELAQRSRWQDYCWLYRGRLRWECDDRAGAMEAYDRALETNPTLADGRYHRARLLLAENRRDDALTDLEALLETSPTHSGGLQAYLDLLDRTESERGFAALGRALAADPNESELHFQANRYAESLGTPTASLRLLVPLLPVVHAPAPLHTYIGTAHLDAGEFDEAEAAFTKALEIDERFTWAITRMGDLNRIRGNDDVAIARWERALELDETLQWPYKALHDLYAERGDGDNRWRVFARRLELDPDNARFQYDLQELAVELGRADDLTALAERLLADDKVRAPHELLVRAAHATYCAKELEAATALVDRAIAHNPRYWWAQSKKADILREQGDKQGALEHYQRCLELRPDDEHSAASTFELLVELERVEEAEARILQDLERMPQDHQLYRMFVNHYRDKDPRSAADAAIALAGRISNVLRAKMAAAALYAAADDTARSVEIYRELTVEMPHDEEAWIALLQIHLDLGDVTEVLVDTARALTAVTHHHCETIELAIAAQRDDATLDELIDLGPYLDVIERAASEDDLADAASTHIRVQPRELGSPEPFAVSRELAAADPFAVALIAVASLRWSDPERAARLLESLTRIRPRSLYANYLLSDALTLLGEAGPALTRLRQVRDARCNRDTDRTAILLALNLLLQGETDKARIAAEAAWAEHVVAPAHQLYGWIELAEAMVLTAASSKDLRAAWQWLRRRNTLRRRVSMPLGVSLAWQAVRRYFA